MTKSPTLIKALAVALTDAAKVNGSVQVRPAAVLWTDADAQWASVISLIRAEVPSVAQLGTFEPESRQGPAIWLKCAVAGLIPEVNGDKRPSVLYLPGVSRSDLRAIESCPRDLQPLAELQYRGVFWSQANGKDWTLGAFLASKNGGLGLDVAQDKATQEALGQALSAGVLLGRSVDDFKGRQINAEWLHSLMAPNPSRDVLVWMNAPEDAKREWLGGRWQVFITRSRSDYGFDPDADGVLVAAELLTKGAGKWAGVMEVYRDAYGSFPNVLGQLSKVPAPQLGLFPDSTQLSGYPQANEQGESALRSALSACEAMDDIQARAVILAAEVEHSIRRGWLWMRMGRSPLAVALGHLARVAELSASVPSGTTPNDMASSYQGTGWQVDAAALNALASVQTKADTDALSSALRAVYLPWMENSALRLQDAVKASGGFEASPGGNSVSATEAGVCTVFVDGLRYDVAVGLQERLKALGEASLQAKWTSMPSVTASGKAWCSPVASLISGAKEDTDFEPRVAADGKPLSGHNFRKLLKENGVQPLEKHETGDSQGQAWTEAGDLDHYGHEHGIRLARDLGTQLDQVLERVVELRDAGWKRFRIVTDHGWLLMPSGLPKSQLALHQAETRWGRCAVLKDTAHGTPLTFGWDWCKDVQVAYAPGVSCFVAGTQYAHGGISLQECLVPILSLVVEGGLAPAPKVTIKAVTWKGLRCVVEVETDATGLTIDVRTKPALASTSLVASVKPLEAGKASLAVADDDHAGAAAVVVVLGPNGEVLQKLATTVGE